MSAMTWLIVAVSLFMLVVLCSLCKSAKIGDIMMRSAFPQMGIDEFKSAAKENIRCILNSHDPARAHWALVQLQDDIGQSIIALRERLKGAAK